MFHIARSFSLALFVVFLWANSVCAQTVPVTVGDYSDNSSTSSFSSSLGYEQRSTCDPDMMKLIESQAWAAAQREVTQDANIYPRPDSVLFVSCFGSWLDHQAWYARRNFPENPRESKGLLGGTYIDDKLGTLIYQSPSDIDLTPPVLTHLVNTHVGPGILADLNTHPGSLDFKYSLLGIISYQLSHKMTFLLEYTIIG